MSNGGRIYEHAIKRVVVGLISLKLYPKHFWKKGNLVKIKRNNILQVIYVLKMIYLENKMILPAWKVILWSKQSGGRFEVIVSQTSQIGRNGYLGQDQHSSNNVWLGYQSHIQIKTNPSFPLTLYNWIRERAFCWLSFLFSIQISLTS